ncbi:BTB/POZ protein [Gigaspora rosea]|uniref:BTB/POZ protein n=1 Tax=Gigaspora rosea TaxID=44941 RepID=A0A397W4T1_9GLOM|nr:BTB/POZ protein [Gigaspora rosea]
MTLKLFEQFSQDFTQLLESEYDYNVVIEVGERPNNQIFRGHSAILYQRSLYFRQNLANTPKENNIIEIKLPHVSVKLFNIIIKYIYGGIVSLENFEISTIFDLLIVANEFNLTELTKLLQSHLIDNHASWLRLNFYRIYQISFLNENFEYLQKFCNNILVKHPRIIFNSDDFINLHENALIELLKNDDLQMEESEIWDKVILWGKAKIQNLPLNLNKWTDENFMSLKTTLHHCLPYIRYFHIPNKEIMEKIKPYHNILEESLWEDIISKSLNPETPINSLILPPRKKESTQLPPRETTNQIKFESFESFIYSWGINENMKTPPLTIKSIRKLKNEEHKMVDYEQNSPYEVETCYVDSRYTYNILLS